MAVEQQFVRDGFEQLYCLKGPSYLNNEQILYDAILPINMLKLGAQLGRNHLLLFFRFSCKNAGKSGKYLGRNRAPIRSVVSQAWDGNTRGPQFATFQKPNINANPAKLHLKLPNGGRLYRYCHIDSLFQDMNGLDGETTLRDGPDFRSKLSSSLIECATFPPLIYTPTIGLPKMYR